MSSPRSSALYVGAVAHHRHRPRPNRFRYRSYHALLDLDELDRVVASIPGLSRNGRTPVSFHDSDHLGPGDRDLRGKLATIVVEHGCDLPDGPIRVLANLRVLGHVFDPVSWWLCYDHEGVLQLVVAEVHNTFGETYPYVLDTLEPVGPDRWRAAADKRFHVSPFLPVEGLDYRFSLHVSHERITARVRVGDADGPLLDAVQTGVRRELTPAALLRVLVTHPLMPLRTVLLIHLQALRLALLRLRFHRKPALPRGGLRHRARPRRPVAGRTGRSAGRTPGREAL